MRWPRLPRTLVSTVKDVEKLDRADPPFKTSTLQQQGRSAWWFSGKKTMKIAQELYEGIDVDGTGPVGLITYMRTDSLKVPDETTDAVRGLIEAEYGGRYLPAKPLRYAAGKSAQEAHEAVRPTDLNLNPEKIRGQLTIDQYKLYQLIYRRFVASQMNPAVFSVTNVAISAGREDLQARRKRVLSSSTATAASLPPGGKQEDALLPRAGARAGRLDLHALDPIAALYATAPRYSEATLIKGARGRRTSAGRAPTLADHPDDPGPARMSMRERWFFATNLGMVVTDLLVKHFPKILDLKFTVRHMEDEPPDDGRDGQGRHGQGARTSFTNPFQEESPGCLQSADGRVPGKPSTPETRQVWWRAGRWSRSTALLSAAGSFGWLRRYPEWKATRPIDVAARRRRSARAAGGDRAHRCPGRQTAVDGENKRGHMAGPARAIRLAR